MQHGARKVEEIKGGGDDGTSFVICRENFTISMNAVTIGFISFVRLIIQRRNIRAISRGSNHKGERERERERETGMSKRKFRFRFTYLTNTRTNGLLTRSKR